MIQLVAKELEKLKEPFVFVGGAIASLYLTDQPTFPGLPNYESIANGDEIERLLLKVGPLH